MYGLKIDKGSQRSLTSQLIKQIREAILSGRIELKSKMPPTRSLAAELGVSRNTVIQAYEQLLAEGYLESAAGSGTFVADLGSIPRIIKPPEVETQAKQRTEQRDSIAFFAGNPDASAFPRALWAKALKEACLDADAEAFGYGPLKGRRELKRALAGYLYRAKGMFCSAERIFIVPGTSAGIELIAHVLNRGGAMAAVEDPCLEFSRNAIKRGGPGLIPVEADLFGMRTEHLPDDRNVRLVYAAPSHQYPLGGVLPIARRLALLDYLERQDAYVIEDDYDSEFRYHGEPVQSLWSLNDERVIYTGSFSNVFSPSLRMAYIIVPQHLLQSFVDTSALMGIQAGTIEQLALARLIESKQFDRHIYRMKRIYDAKRKVLIGCLKEAFGAGARISGELAGMHITVSLDRDITDEEKKALLGNGVEVDYAEDYAIIKGKHKGKLVLGYGNLDKAQIEEGVRRLKLSLG